MNIETIASTENLILSNQATPSGVRGAFLTGAQAIMQCLVEQGVDTIFGYPGGAIMPTYDAICNFNRHSL